MKYILLLMIVFGCIKTMAAKGYTPEHCSSYTNSNIPCDKEFKGLEYRLCSVCREKKSCFWIFPRNRMRNFCMAYLEGDSCLMAFDRGTNRQWCEVLIEGKSCSVIKSSGQNKNCMKGKYPKSHLFWVL